MGKRTLYLADWHYDHANCIAFDNRPFKTADEMNAELVRRWNDAVGKNDTVYVLGDMFWCGKQRALPVMDALNGTKVLIRGNHDRVEGSEFLSRFDGVADYLEVKDGDRNIVLCHYPIPCYKNHFYGWCHFYGHVHNSFEWNMTEHDQYLMHELYGRKSLMVNVGVMMPWMDYTPKTADEIIKEYLEWRGCQNERSEANP